MTSFAAIMVGLSVGSLVLLAVPLWRLRALNRTTLAISLAIPALATALFLALSEYPPEIADVAGAIEALTSQLREHPENVATWEQLGGIYFIDGKYNDAATAYAEAWRRSSAPAPSLKLAYAEASLLAQRDTVSGLAGQLIEQVLIDEPDNSRALLYGAMAAETRNDPSLARQRWRRLLDQHPPEQIAQIVQERLDALESASVMQANEQAVPAASN